MHWIKIRENLFAYQDSCRVYAVRGPSGTVLVNAGTGRCAKHLSEITVGGALTGVLTHHFRDHTDGA